MKKALLLFLIAFAFAKANSQELYLQPYNTDFEISDADGMPTGWYLPSSLKDPNLSIGIVDYGAESGKRCVEMNAATSLNKYGALLQKISAESYKGRTLAIKAFVMTSMSSGSANLWCEALDKDGNSLYTATSPDNTILSPVWSETFIIVEIPKNAATINYGIFLNGIGKIRIDNFSIEPLDKIYSLNTPSKELSPLQIESLTAFAKLYSIARFYSPFPDTVGFNWDYYLYRGIQDLLPIKNNDELLTYLNQRISSIYPNLKVYKTGGTKPTFTMPAGADPNNEICAANSVFFSYSKLPSLGKAIANGAITQRESEGAIYQSIDTTGVRGKVVTLKAYAKGAPFEKGAKIELGIVAEKMGQPNIVGMNDAIKGNVWTEYIASGKVPEDCDALKFSIALMGDGFAYFDELKAFVKEKDGSEREIKINNPGFEQLNPSGSYSGWSFLVKSKAAGYIIAKPQDGDVYKGASCAVITTSEESRIKMPSIDETIEGDLPLGLSFKALLANYGDSIDVLPRIDYRNKDYKINKDEKFAINKYDLYSRIAAVISEYAILRNFSLDYGLPTPNYDSSLQKALKIVAVTELPEIELPNALKLLAAPSNDGVIKIWSSDALELYAPRLFWELVGDKLVIKKSFGDIENTIKKGDIVVEINSKPTSKAIDEQLKYVSGNNLILKQKRALANLKYGDNGSTLKLKINRDGKFIDVNLKRNAPTLEQFEKRPDSFTFISDSIYYIDATTAQVKDFKNKFDDLYNAKAVIIDLRGNTSLTSQLLSTYTTNKGMQPKNRIPIFSYPEKKYVNYITKQNEFKSSTRKMNVLLYLLIDDKTEGNSETIASTAQDLKIGELIGQKTSGNTSLPVAFSLPCGYFISMSKDEVYGISGNLINDKGIEPSIPLKIEANDYLKYDDPFISKTIELIKLSK